MNILFLSQVVPYPPDAGPKVKTWQVLRYLSGLGHQVSLACFVRPEEEAYLPVLRAHFAAVYAVPLRRSRIADFGFWLRSHVTGRPFLVERDNLAGMRSLVDRLVATGQVDVIHADQLSMAQFALDGWGTHPQKERPFLIFDAHNAVWTVTARMQQNAPAWLRPAIALEAQRVKRYEGKIVRAYDQTLAVTELDRQALRQAVKSTQGAADNALDHAPITVIPITVDTSQLNPITVRPDSSNLLTLGTLHYPPNADGIRWFANEVFPLVRQQAPEARLTIVGKNPPADFLQLAAQAESAVTVTGYAPDLLPYLEQAAVMVIPVRAGGGMRVRILEAFARALPVVTTTVGLEGIDAIPGKDVFVADTPAEFAAGVVRLLRDQDLRAQLAQNSRRLVEKNYDWRIALKKLDDIYGRIKPPAAAAPRMEESLEQAR